MKTLILLRGLPGSGKSTLAQMFPTVFLYESDKYFEDENGNYNFDASKLHQAHKWCQSRVELAMNAPNGFPPPLIIVSNTFTQEWEMDHYYELAKKYEYTVFSTIVENRHGGINIHNCPEDKIQAMRSRFQIRL